jgi:hypothetical protein
MEKVSIVIRTYTPVTLCALGGGLYSSTELDWLGFCELQQPSDIY